MSFDPLEFRDRRVVVTGGTQSAGRAVIQRLADAGALVVTAARRPKSAALPVHTYVQADLTRAADVEELVETMSCRSHPGGSPLMWHSG